MVNIGQEDGSQVPAAAASPTKQEDADLEHLDDAQSDAQPDQVPLARSESFTGQYLDDHAPNDLITEEVKIQPPPGCNAQHDSRYSLFQNSIRPSRKFGEPVLRRRGRERVRRQPETAFHPPTADRPSIAVSAKQLADAQSSREVSSQYRDQSANFATRVL